jgi:hypothetical protein
MNLNCEALEGRQLLSYGNYFVNEASGKVLGDPGFSTSNGTGIIQWQLTGGKNERWDIASLPNGNSVIINRASGKDLGDPGFSKSNGTGIVQWVWNQGLNEQWRLYRLGNGNYAIINAASGLALDDPGGGKSNWTQMVQWQWNGGLNQQWALMAAADNVVTDYVLAVDEVNTLYNAGNSAYAQREMLINGAPNLEWTFVQMDNGYWVIVNEATGLVLDNRTNSTSAGALIQVSQLNQRESTASGGETPTGSAVTGVNPVACAPKTGPPEMGVPR